MTDLGDLAGLATALGLIDGNGSLVAGWFSRPGDYLSNILRSEPQRAALIDFVDEVLGGEEASTDAAGRTWLPIVDVENGKFSAFVVIEPSSAHVAIGAGLRSRLTTADGVGVDLDVHVPLFAQPSAAGPLRVLPGDVGIFADVALSLALSPGPVGGGVSLGGVRLAASIPLWEAGEPRFELALRGLQLPGGGAPRDLSVAAADIDDLDDAILDLVMGLVRAQAASLPANDPVRGLAGILGLADDDVPDLPVGDLLSRGPRALADWFGNGLLDPDGHHAWMTDLAHLFGGGVTGTGLATVADVALPQAHLIVSVDVARGPSGGVVVTPRLRVSVDGASGVELALDVDAARIDLATGAAVAVPRLAVTANIAGAGGTPLLPPTPPPPALTIGVGSFHAGFALDPARRPVLVVEGRNVDVGTSHFDVLDLTSPDALAAAATNVVTNAAGSLLANFGAAGAVVAALLGLGDVPGGPSLPRVDPTRLLSDPLGALAARWAALLAGPAAGVESVLNALRSSIADAGVAAVVTRLTTDGQPWLVPVADGLDLTVRHDDGHLAVGFRTHIRADLAPSGIAGELAIEAAVVELDLGTGGRPRRGAFLPGVHGALRLTGTGGTPLSLGSPPVAISATAVGIGVDWRAGSSPRVTPVMDGVQLVLPSGEVELPIPRFDPSGRLAFDDGDWDAIEALVGASAADLALRLDAQWLLEIVRLLGWSDTRADGGPRLSLAELVTAPGPALQAWATELVDVAGAASLDLVLQVVERVLGLPSSRLGAGTVDHPWRLALTAAADDLATEVVGDVRAAFLAAVGPDGPDWPATQINRGLAAWRPGDPGLESDALITSLLTEAGIDDELADIVVGRGDVVTGLDEIASRIAGTDGLVTLPATGLPTGVTPHRLSEWPHSRPLGDLDLTAIIGAAAPATIVCVAVIAPGVPAVLPTVDADHIVDLTGPHLPAEAFSFRPAAVATGTWGIRLAGRADARLDSGDPDGIGGQTARLQRVLPALVDAAGGPIVVVAHGGAGPAAVRACTDQPGVAAVITVGTPWSPLVVDALDRLPGAEALRMLTTLLEDAGLPTDELADDSDLASARSVLALWSALDDLGDPLAELRPPGSLGGAGTVPVHAVVGSVGGAAVSRAVTATFAAALARRARARSDAERRPPDSLQWGFRLPLLPAGSRGGLVSAATIDLRLSGPGAGFVPTVVLTVKLAAQTGWLVGGPDPGRSPGSARTTALRRLTLTASVPLGGGPTTTRLVLHDVRAFDIRRARWVVELGALAAAGSTPLLPELRAVLGQVAVRLGASAADPAGAAFCDLLHGLGVLGADGGFDAVSLENLLLDAREFTASVRADASRRASVAKALRTLVADIRADAGDSIEVTTGPVSLRIDLGTGSLSARARALSGSPGWQARVGVGADGRIALDARLGPDLPAPGTPEAADPRGGAGVALLLASAPLTATIRVRRPREVTDVRLWPTPDGDVLLAALSDAAPAALLTVAVDAARAHLEDASPTALAALDAVLDLLGLLGAARAPLFEGDPAPRRALALPGALLADPAAWLGALPAAGGAGLVAVLPGVLDALRQLLGAGGSAGRLEVATGVAIRATASAGRVDVGLDVDSAQFAGAGDPGRLVLAGSAAVGISVDSIVPVVSAGIGVSGVGRVDLGVAPDAGGATSVTLVLRPEGGVDIPILPAGPGLGAAVGGAAAAAAVRALPAVLDAIASNDPAGAPNAPDEIAGRLVARLGDALDLRTGAVGSRAFSHSALTTFGTDPAGALAARAPALAVAGLGLLEQAIGPVLGPVTRTVRAAGGALVITIGPTTVRWQPGAGRVDATVSATGLPGVGKVTASVGANGTGLVALDVAVGPANLAAGPVVLRPFARVRAGTAPVGGPAVEVGLGLTEHRQLAARWTLPSGAFGLVAIDDSLAQPESTTAEAIALAAVSALVDLVGTIVLSVPQVSTGLDAAFLGTTARTVLTGVLLDPAHTDRIDLTLLDPERLLPRVGRLLANLNGVGVTVDSALRIELHSRADGASTAYGITLSVEGSYPLGGSDVTVSLEDDGTWIDGAVPEGLTLEVLAVDGAGAVDFRPGITVGGLGVRLARASGPLLDTALRIESVALNLFASVTAPVNPADPPVVSGGVRMQLAGLAVALAGATGGENTIASGMLASGDEPPQPKFSPAIAVQKHAGGEVMVSLSAGDGPGPWWIAIQRGFGPIYVEQVGLAVTVEQRRLSSVGVLLDAKASIFGLSAAVDDLSITYLISSNRSMLDPAAWRVDLAGLAITADVGGLVLAGAFRRFPVPAGGIEYLGMLVARLGVYGLSLYGGYGVVGPANDQYTSLFLFGAVNGPIGGPPAFFVTGIGGGLGINRRLKYPSDLSQFGSYPLIKALDPAARPGDPMTELVEARDYFPAERDTFWFAAGLSFNSFALVDGVAVIAVQIGDGFELSLLGLARMALPRPQAALVSVELGLLARFSTKEGMLLVQAQLTDNSWLLFPDIKLTGGFAFAAWFGGPNRGQFVLTLGGYHPDFRRDGYPAVPRLGVQYRLGDWLTITGATYFALTSEALMAGVRIEAHASLGPAWAHLVIGGDGIVFFDPFFLSVTVYASISAGVTIDVWIGEITISVSLSARVTLSGPPFHGRAEFSVGPVDLAVEFGDDAIRPPAISWDAFVPKYLEAAAPVNSQAVAHVLAAVPGTGAAPPAGRSNDGGAKSPDGSDGHPFLVVAEFVLTITSMAPVRELDAGQGLKDLPTTPEISAAPMRAAAKPKVTLTFVGPSHADAPTDKIANLRAEAQRLGAFAIGTWGPAQQQDDAKVPRGDVIPAVDRIALTAEAAIATSPAGAPDIKYRQVEVAKDHKRRPLPFVVEGAAGRRTQLRNDARKLASTVPSLHGRPTVEVAAELVRDRAGAVASVRNWAAPPLLGSLGEGLGSASVLAQTADSLATAREPLPLRQPVVAAVLAAPAASVPLRKDAAIASVAGIGTTVSDELLKVYVDWRGSRPVTAAPPSLATVDRSLLAAIPARLVTLATPAAALNNTVLPTTDLPVTRSGRSGIETVAGRAADTLAAQELVEAGRALRDGRLDVPAGQLVVLSLPDAWRDVDPSARPELQVRTGRVRLIALLPGGPVADDVVLGEGGTIAMRPGTRAVAVAAVGEDTAGGVYGWDSASPLPYLGDEVFVAAGAVVRSAGRVPGRRFAQVRTGWAAPDQVVAGATAVSTEFAGPVQVVAVALEGGAGDDLAVGVSGATRRLGANGLEEPPILVADGSRAVAILRVTPVDGERVVITVATGESRSLVGVAGIESDAYDEFAQAIADRGFAAVVPDPLGADAPSAAIAWKEG